jgi:hypothetical protein
MVVADVHTPAYPDAEAVLGQNVPNALLVEGVTVGEVEDPVLPVAHPRAHGHPLDPRLKVRRFLLPLRHVDLRFAIQLLETRKLSLGHEAAHQRRAKFIELK